MARKLPGFRASSTRRRSPPVAYGEIASSIYFALGIVARTRSASRRSSSLVVGLLFLVVALSYAEGTAAYRETGGAATFVRVAFNDLAGFLTGWALFLDYLIVIALSALFIPHYLGLALGSTRSTASGGRHRRLRRHRRRRGLAARCAARSSTGSGSSCRCSTS